MKFSRQDDHEAEGSSNTVIQRESGRMTRQDKNILDPVRRVAVDSADACQRTSDVARPRVGAAGATDVLQPQGDGLPEFLVAFEGIEVVGHTPGKHDYSVPADRHVLDICLDGDISTYSEDGNSPSPCPPRSFCLLPAGSVRQLTVNRTGRTLRISFTTAFATQAGLDQATLQVPIRHRLDSALLGAANISFDHLIRRGKDASAVELNALALTMLARLTHFLTSGPIGSEISNPVRRAVAFIDENLSVPLPIAVVAEHAGSSPYHFCRIFRNAMNVSPHQYITIRRIELAKRLIESTDESLAEIAYRAGFGSQSHMTTTFKRVLNETPGQIRRRVAA